ncbi:MAG: NUDIX hydrolase [Verrucomicrobiales bacterium]|nr:NUDIX hydrolase [Verrucomicrobiales bacterium]
MRSDLTAYPPHRLHMERNTPHTVRCVLASPEETPRFLLARHTHQHQSRIGKWGLLGGRPTAFESPEQALRRELLQEIGFCPSKLHEIGLYVEDLPPVAGDRRTHVVYAGVVKDRRCIAIVDADEVSAIRWFSLEELQGIKEEGLLTCGFELAAARDASRLLQ